ncbi:MAG: helix-turn-helix domain-containing protein, partial [Acidimicrobiia bacterium]
MSIVQRIRQMAGMTQREFAERAATSQPAIAAYESGAKLPSLRTLQRLASA